MTTDTKQLFVTCQFCIVIKGNAAEDGFLLPSCWAKKQTNTRVSCLKRLLPHLPLRGPIMICMSSDMMLNVHIKHINAMNICKSNASELKDFSQLAVKADINQNEFLFFICYSHNSVSTVYKLWVLPLCRLPETRQLEESGLVGRV